MKILITGANGLLGSSLINLLSKEHEVFALIKNKNKISFDLNSNVKIIESNLCDFNTDSLNEDIDIIYYLAQSNKFRDFPEGARDMFEININTPLKIIEWASQNNVKSFVYASSGGVYTNPEKPVKEFFDINANEKHGFYLDSKLNAEILLKNYAHFFKSFVIIRPFFMYGEKQNQNMLIPRLINNIRNNEVITLNGKNGIVINPIYVEDASLAVKNIMNIIGEHIINIAGEDILSLKELSELIGSFINCTPKFNINDNVQNNLVADITLMKEKLHSPAISINNGIKRMVNI